MERHLHTKEHQGTVQMYQVVKPQQVIEPQNLDTEENYTTKFSSGMKSKKSHLCVDFVCVLIFLIFRLRSKSKKT